MAITLSTLIRGPAMIQWGATPLKYYTRGNVVLTLTKETFEVPVAGYGDTAPRVSEEILEVSFTPAGEWEDGPFQALFPGASTVEGASWFGTDDAGQALIIQPINTGQQAVTILNANIVGIPQLNLSAVKPLIGSAVRFRGLLSNASGLNLAWSNAAAFYSLASGTPDNAGYDDTKVITQPYVGVWGAVTGFTTIHTVDGWTVDFDLQLAPVPTDAYGVLDMTFQKLVVTARCMPLGPTEAQAHTAFGFQGTGKIRGMSLATGSADLSLKPLAADDSLGTALAVLKNAQLVSIGGQYGSEATRHGEYVWRAMRTFSSGVPSALFTLATPS